jgi:hypothetical protein
MTAPTEMAEELVYAVADQMELTETQAQAILAADIAENVIQDIRIAVRSHVYAGTRTVEDYQRLTHEFRLLDKPPNVVDLLEYLGRTSARHRPVS